MADSRNPNYPTKENGRIIAPTGVEVFYGAPKISFGATGIFICQNCTKSQAGEMKEYNDEAGETCVMVLKGDHREFSIDGFASKDLPDQKQGAQFTLTLKIPGETDKVYKPRVQTWQKSYANEDLAKISMTARTYPAIDGGSSCDPEYTDATGPTAPTA